MHPAISVRLPEDIDRRLTLLADRTGRTKTYYIREALERHLEDMEDIYDAEQELLAVRAGKSRTYSHQEVRDILGLGNQTV